MLSAMRRISDAKRSAQEILFDDNSRFVIMSDVHRGNGDERMDNFARNQTIYYAALQHYNHEAFTYIELGDGDELWENKRLSEIMWMYRDVYELLADFYRDDRLLMIYGNHDYVKKDQRYVEEHYKRYFPKIKVYESILLKHRVSRGSLLLIHGHQSDFLNDPLWKLARFLVWNLWRRIELIGVNDPTSAAKNNRRRITVENKMIRWAELENQILIAGHTHRPVFPVRGESLYFNDGSCVHPGAITAIEIVRGSIALVKWSVKARRDGTLFVGKDVIAGPHRLSKYFEHIRRREKALQPP